MVTIEDIEDIVRETSSNQTSELRIQKKAKIVAKVLDMDQGSALLGGAIFFKVLSLFPPGQHVVSRDDMHT